MKYFYFFISFFALSLVSYSVLGQNDTIFLTNPSFEGIPRAGGTGIFYLRGWQNCPFAGQTPPDVHPVPDGTAWKVTHPPIHGETYLGMVARDNYTWERVSQRLRSPMETGTCYSFSIHLARSIIYESKSQVTELDANYAEPIKLRIWGGKSYCERSQLLSETPLVQHPEWRKYNFKLTPKVDFSYIMLEVFYQTPTLVEYNGNIILDYASNLVPIACDETVVISEYVTPPPEQIIPKDYVYTPPLRKNNPQTTPVETSEPPTPQEVILENKAPKEYKSKILKDLDRRTIKEGQIIQIKNLYFKADSAKINPESFPVLEDIYRFLDANSQIRLEVGGHTNGVPGHEYCDWLSTARAKAVSTYLISKGINKSQIEYKGYGKRQRIASDKSLAGRMKNQRVELKILSLG